MDGVPATHRGWPLTGRCGWLCQRLLRIAFGVELNELNNIAAN